MCQLTFVNLHRKKLNQLYLINQALINTKIDHRDGFGIFTSEKNRMWKTEKKPWDLADFGKVFAEIVSNKPALMHVRKASYLNRSKEVKIENTHPFILGDIVLAHNGTLESVDEKKFSDKSFDSFIDSELFLYTLNEKYLEEDDFVKCIAETVKEFYGKFAFIIYNMKTKKWYAVKGTTATLYLYYIKEIINGEEKDIGYVINTEKESMINGLVQFFNLAMADGIYLSYDEDTLQKIKDNIIVELGNELKLVGEVKEHTKPYNKTEDDNYDHIYGWGTTYRGTSAKLNYRVEHIFTDGLVPKGLVEFYDMCQEWDISLSYADSMLKCILGTPLLQTTIDDINFFNNNIKEELDELMGEEFVDYVTMWRKIKSESVFLDDIFITEMYNIPFPYMLSTLDNLKRILEVIIQENKEKKSK